MIRVPLEDLDAVRRTLFNLSLDDVCYLFEKGPYVEITSSCVEDEEIVCNSLSFSGVDFLIS